MIFTITLYHHLYKFKVAVKKCINNLEKIIFKWYNKIIDGKVFLNKISILIILYYKRCSKDLEIIEKYVYKIF